MIENKIEIIILNKAKEEADEIISGALLGASEIIERAKEKVPQIIDEYIKRANNFVAQERQRIIGKAQLEINARMISIENEVLNRVFEGIEEEVIEALKDKQTYKNYLKNLIDEVFRNNIFQKPVVKVNPRDYNILKEILNDVQIETDDNVEYGIVVEDVERGFIVRNTLKTRIEKVKQIVIEKIRDYWK